MAIFLDKPRPKYPATPQMMVNRATHMSFLMGLTLYLRMIELTAGISIMQIISLDTVPPEMSKFAYLNVNVVTARHRINSKTRTSRH